MEKLSIFLVFAVFVFQGCSEESLLDTTDLNVADALQAKAPKDNFANGELEVTIAKAPVAPDGTTAKAITDIVLTFVNPDPEVEGIGLKSGGHIEVELPKGFKNTGAGGDGIIILQGWPQSPPIPFLWTTTVVDNIITATLTSDYLPGMFGPGPKQAHLLLLGFENPKPGKQQISLSIKPDPNSMETFSGVGEVIIMPKARPSIHAVSVFSGPPGPPPPFFNPLYQTVTLGQTARQVGMYLWDKGNEPFVGVNIESINPGHGRMVKNGSTVGHVWIDAPVGATDYNLSTAGPSTEVNTVVTGIPTGLLLIEFNPDPLVAGNYALVFQINNGNTQNLFVNVTP